MIKKLVGIKTNTVGHWVGDGFPVRTLFAYPESGRELDPFLMLDYAGPKEFPPSGDRRGVGEHPHRGFETVTIVYSGTVEHRDSSGGGGTIRDGDVQWMTAGSGVVHEEFHGREFARSGGVFEVIQLWINLPAKDKMTPPRYQALTADSIPVVDLGNDRGTLRVIAGDSQGVRGPATTFSPIHVWDLRLTSEAPFSLEVPEGLTTALVVRRGSATFGERTVSEAEVAVFSREGTTVHFDRAEDAECLLLCGEPLGEPIVGAGPFVMNTAEEIDAAVADYRSGRMGHLNR